MNAMARITSEGEPEVQGETLLMMELRHAQERAELIERLTQEAYAAGLHDRAKPGTIGGALSLMEQITAKVAAEYKVLSSELRGPSAMRSFNAPRRAIWCELRERGYSFPQIGKFFGRDHSTIMHGVRQHEAES